MKKVSIKRKASKKVTVKVSRWVKKEGSKKSFKYEKEDRKKAYFSGEVQKNRHKNEKHKSVF